MKYSIQKLRSDVMARLGEIARPQTSLTDRSALSAVPWPEDIIGLKVASLLGEIGSELIREAPAEVLGGAPVKSGGEMTMRMMPCGLYGAEVRLPEGFLRLMSVKMAGWRRGVHTLVLPASEEWTRQWSEERGIAGCPERPQAYLDRDADGMLLRLLCSDSEEDSLECLSGWCVPLLDEEGEFDFPEALYAELVGAIAAKLL